MDRRTAVVARDGVLKMIENDVDTTYSYQVPEGWYLFYSATAEMKYGSVTYEAEDGDWVLVTCVSRDETGKGYNYDDKKMVGKAVRYIGLGRKGNFHNPQPIEPTPWEE